MRALLGSNAASVMRTLIPIIRGWAAYYRTQVSSEVFSALDDYMWKLLYKKSAFYVWVNGEKIGCREDSYVPSEFDLTDHLQPGTNLIALEVYRFSDGDWLEDQDMIRLSCIFRSVHLFSTPNVHLRDFRLETPLRDGYTNADLSVTASVRDYRGGAFLHGRPAAA